MRSRNRKLASSGPVIPSCGVARKLPCVTVKLRPDQCSDRIRDMLVRGKVQRGAPTLAYYLKESSCIPDFPEHLHHLLPVKYSFDQISREASLAPSSSCGESLTAPSSFSQSTSTVTLPLDLVGLMSDPSEEVVKELVDEELEQGCGGLTRVLKRAVLLAHSEWPLPVPLVVAQLCRETGARPAGVREEYWNLTTSSLRMVMAEGRGK